MWANVAIFIVMVGGIGSIEGVLIGSLIFFVADRWFGEYGATAIGMFDPATEKIKEWLMPTPWSQPYDAAPTKGGVEVWTGSMLTDQVARLNTKTDTIVEYLLPRSTNIRRVHVDNSTTPVTFWVGSNHGASIIKLEPMD